MSLENYGEYQLIKKLAAGGMAQIYLARQQGMEGFEKLLVVKRILPHLAENEEFIKMFLDEARIAARLNHPNIVQIFNLGAQDDSFFIAMEYIHGEDVRRVWKRADSSGKPIPVPLVCRIVMDAAAGLDYAHKKLDNAGKPLGIVHRDISPQNILVTFEGGVKIVDFGIAKAADQATVTKSGVLKGKYSYMSPEQASGQKIDRRSDIFALGVVLYELLTGARLFKRSNDVQTLNAVAECNVAPPSSVNNRVPASLDAVVMKALQKNPDERYSDAAELQAALEDWLLQNKLPSSSVHLAAFLQDIYADRLKREAEEGRVLVEEADKSRSPEENFKATPATKSQQKATGSRKPGSGPLPLADVTRADRSDSKERGKSRSGFSEERERQTGRTESAVSITQANPGGGRFPWVLAALLVAIGASAGAWLVLRSPNGGTVRLVTDPPGAAVTLDDTLVPDLATPCTLPKKPAGQYKLTLSKKGYYAQSALVTYPASGEVTLPPFRLEKEADDPVGQKPPDPVPTPKAVSITFKTMPPGAIVWVDGKKIGAAPLTVELAPGSIVPLKFESSSYREVEETFTTPDQAGEHLVTLEKEGGKKKQPDKKGPDVAQPPPVQPAAKALGKVRFVVKPWATVVCDGLNFGDTPFADKEMPAGIYKCVFTNPELNEKRTEIVRVDANVLTKVSVNLKQ